MGDGIRGKKEPSRYRRGSAGMLTQKKKRTLSKPWVFPGAWGGVLPEGFKSDQKKKTKTPQGREPLRWQKMRGNKKSRMRE